MTVAKNLGGRPEFKPSDDQRRRVAISAAAGMTHEEIAIGIGISRPTLDKYFEFELSHGALAKRIDVFDAMYSLAMKGNASAQKNFASFTPARAAPPIPDHMPTAKPEGKKAQQNADAKVAQKGTEWEDLLPRTAH